jgi:predicted acyltransferase
MDCNFARYLDQLAIAGHTWLTPSHNDPDGILSDVSSIGSVLCGAVTVQLMLAIRRPIARVSFLMFAGLMLITAGALAAIWIPVSKVLWTPSR